VYVKGENRPVLGLEIPSLSTVAWVISVWCIDMETRPPPKPDWLW